MSKELIDLLTTAAEMTERGMPIPPGIAIEAAETIERLQAENEALQDICAAAYQMAGAVDAPLRFLDALSNPCEATQEQIDALLPVREDEFDEITALRKDAERLNYLEENTNGLDCGLIDNTPVYRVLGQYDWKPSIRHAIDAARATSTSIETSPPLQQEENPARDKTVQTAR